MWSTRSETFNRKLSRAGTHSQSAYPGPLPLATKLLTNTPSSAYSV